MTDMLVIVTNEVGMDGITYSSETMQYISAMAELNQTIAQMADAIIECVCGIPLVIKGEMSMLKSLCSAFLMYSRIPVPKVEWNEENRRYALCFFPVIGVSYRSSIAILEMALFSAFYRANAVCSGFCSDSGLDYRRNSFRWLL